MHAAAVVADAEARLQGIALCLALWKRKVANRLWYITQPTAWIAAHTTNVVAIKKSISVVGHACSVMIRHASLRHD